MSEQTLEDMLANAISELDSALEAKRTNDETIYQLEAYIDDLENEIALTK